MYKNDINNQEMKNNFVIYFVAIITFAICTSPLIHLASPPKFCISIAFNVVLEDYNTWEKLKESFLQNFGGQTKCILGDVQMVNTGI